MVAQHKNPSNFLSNIQYNCKRSFARHSRNKTNAKLNLTSSIDSSLTPWLTTRNTLTEPSPLTIQSIDQEY